MRRHRVGAEGVHDQQSILARGCFPQSQTRVAKDHMILGLRAVAQKCEITRVRGNPNDRRIDVVEIPLLSLHGVGSNRARAEPCRSYWLDRRLAVVNSK